MLCWEGEGFVAATQNYIKLWTLQEDLGCMRLRVWRIKSRVPLLLQGMTSASMLQALLLEAANFQQVDNRSNSWKDAKRLRIYGHNHILRAYTILMFSMESSCLS